MRQFEADKADKADTTERVRSREEYLENAMRNATIHRTPTSQGIQNIIFHLS
jgi:hypothetical protein